MSWKSPQVVLHSELNPSASSILCFCFTVFYYPKVTQVPLPRWKKMDLFVFSPYLHESNFNPVNGPGSCCRRVYGVWHECIFKGCSYELTNSPIPWGGINRIINVGCTQAESIQRIVKHKQTHKKRAVNRCSGKRDIKKVQIKYQLKLTGCLFAHIFFKTK